MKIPTTEELNRKLLAACEAAAARFPEMDPRLIGRVMKVAVAAAEIAALMKERYGRPLTEAEIAQALELAGQHFGKAG